jgi:Leucine-rich repeat (LRR) protein
VQRLADALLHFPAVRHLELHGACTTVAAAFSRVRVTTQIKALTLRTESSQPLAATLRHLAQLSHLTRMDLAGCGRGGRSMLDAAKLLPKFPALASLAIEGLHIATNDAAQGGIIGALKQRLSRLTALTQLTIDQGPTASPRLRDGVLALAPCLAPLLQLRELRLIGYERAAKNMPQLTTLTGLPQLSLLELSFKHLAAAGAAQALAALTADRQLVLSVSMCEEIKPYTVPFRSPWKRFKTADAYKALASVLGACTQLHGLEVLNVWPHIRLAEVHLKQQIAQLTQLRVLRMAPTAAQIRSGFRPRHPIKEAPSGFRACQTLLPQMTNLTRLDLRGETRRAFEAAERFPLSVAALVGLAHLALEQLCIRDGAQLALQLEPLSALSYLSLAENVINITEDILPCLSSLPGLMHLDLPDMGIEDAALVSVAAGLGELSALTYLGLQDNRFGEIGRSALSPCLARMRMLREVGWAENVHGVWQPRQQSMLL